MAQKKWERKWFFHSFPQKVGPWLYQMVSMLRWNMVLEMNINSVPRCSDGNDLTVLWQKLQTCSRCRALHSYFRSFWLTFANLSAIRKRRLGGGANNQEWSRNFETGRARKGGEDGEGKVRVDDGKPYERRRHNFLRARKVSSDDIFRYLSAVFTMFTNL